MTNANETDQKQSGTVVTQDNSASAETTVLNTSAPNSISPKDAEVDTLLKEKKSPDIAFENALSNQALANVQAPEDSDNFSADDIAMAIDSLGHNKAVTTKDAPSTLGHEADQEVSNMLQEQGASSVNVTMPSEDEPRLKVFDENGKELSERELNTSTSNTAIIRSTAPNTPKGPSSMAKESTTSIIRGSGASKAVSNTIKKPESATAIVSGSASSNSPKSVEDDSKVMGDSDMNSEGTTAISGMEKRHITPMRKSGFSAPNLANMSPEDRAIFEKFSKPHSSSAPASEAAKAAVEHKDVADDSKVMGNSDMNSEGTTAISGMEQRHITPMRKSGFSAPNLANMSPEDRAIFEKFSKPHGTKAPMSIATPSASSALAAEAAPVAQSKAGEEESKVMGGSDMNSEGTTAIIGLENRQITPIRKSGFSAPNLAKMSPEERAIYERFTKGKKSKAKLADDESMVMDGSDMNSEGTTAIIGLENRHVTPVRKSGLSAPNLDKMSPEEREVFDSYAKGSSNNNSALNRTFDNTGSYRMEARDNETHMQTGSSNIVRNNDAKANSNVPSQINNATVSEYGTTAISGLNNRMVLAETPDTSTVITGSGASLFESTTSSDTNDYDDYDGLVAPVYTNEMESSSGMSNGIVDDLASNRDPFIKSEEDNSSEFMAAPLIEDNPAYNNNPVYDYAQYDAGEVMAMPTQSEAELVDASPQYFVGPQDHQDNESLAPEEDNPYQFGTYANKLAYENERRLHPNDNRAPERQASSEPLYEQGLTDNGDGPVYYGTYASQLERQNQMNYEEQAQDPMEYNNAPMIEDESLVPEPAGMGDGALSQVNLKSTNDYVPDVSNDGPVYYVGPKEPPKEQAEDDGPIYAIGANSKNADAVASLMAARSKMQQGRTSAYEMDPLADEPLSAEEAAAYEQALADAARESMAAPKSEVVKRARMLAAQDDFELVDEQGMGPMDEQSFNEKFDVTDTEATALGEANATLKPSTNERKQQEINADKRREDNGQYNFANMPVKEQVSFGMMICLYLRQLIASFFTHTTLPLVAPQLALRLGPCYPSSMPIPFFVVGFIAGALGSVLHSTLNLDYIGAVPYLIFLLLTGLTGYRGIYRICSFITRKRHDVILLTASVMVPMLIFVWLSNTLIGITSGIVEATAAFAIASMLAAATASSLNWNFPQDPMDSCGHMSTKGLLFVIILSIMAAFGLLHYTVGLSVMGVSLVMRLLFGYFIGKNQGTAQRPYVYALQLLTLFAILLDLILLKSQNYEFLSQSSLDLVTYLRSYSNFF